MSIDLSSQKNSVCVAMNENSGSEAGTHAQTFLSVLKFGLASVFPEMHVNILRSGSWNKTYVYRYKYQVPGYRACSTGTRLTSARVLVQPYLAPLRNIEVTICKHQADSPFYVWPDVWSGICKLKKSMIIHDTECPYWDQVSLNNTNQTKPGWKPTLCVTWCLTWWFESFVKRVVIHDTECPYWDQVSVNNTNL